MANKYLLLAEALATTQEKKQKRRKMFGRCVVS
jgi:hypothetical protein